jgi:hypothetical protein
VSQLERQQCGIVAELLAKGLEAFHRARTPAGLHRRAAQGYLEAPPLQLLAVGQLLELGHGVTRKEATASLGARKCRIVLVVRIPKGLVAVKAQSQAGIGQRSESGSRSSSGKGLSIHRAFGGRKWLPLEVASRTCPARSLERCCSTRFIRAATVT